MSTGSLSLKAYPNLYLVPNEQKSHNLDSFKRHDYLGEKKQEWEYAEVPEARHPDLNAAIGRFVHAFQAASMVPLENMDLLTSTRPDEERINGNLGLRNHLPDRVTSLPVESAAMVFRQRIGGLIREWLEINGKKAPAELFTIPPVPNDTLHASDGSSSADGQFFYLQETEAYLSSLGDSVMGVANTFAKSFVEDIANRASLSTPSARRDLTWVRDNFGSTAGVRYSTLNPADLMARVKPSPLLAFGLSQEDRRRLTPWITG